MKKDEDEDEDEDVKGGIEIGSWSVLWGPGSAVDACGVRKTKEDGGCELINNNQAEQ